MDRTADQPAEGEAERGPDLDALYRRLQPALLRHLRLSDSGQAEDIAAEVWLEVLRLLPRFRGGDDAFRAWVFTLARRRMIDGYRRASRRRAEPLVGDGYESPARGPEEQALDRLSAKTAIARLQRVLPPHQSEVVLLRVVGGLSVDQVAVRTGKQPVNVRVLQHRGLRRLDERLGAELRPA